MTRSFLIIVEGDRFYGGFSVRKKNDNIQFCVIVLTHFTIETDIRA